MSAEFEQSTAARRNFALILLWVTPALWSSNYIIARAANGIIAPHMLALGRWTLALALLLPWVWRDLAKQFPHWRGEWKQMLALGALGMWICGAFVYIGGQSTSATNIGLIYAAAPVGIAVAGRWLLHETVSISQRAAMLVALLGVLVVISRGHLLNLIRVQFSVGDIWIAMAAISWVAYSVLQQHWSSVLAPRQRLACISAGGVLVLIPFTALEYWLTDPMAPSGKAVLLIALAGVLPGFLCYQAYAIMLNELGATRTSLVMYLSPIYAAFVAWWLLHEAPQWFHAVGALLVLPSIYLATRATNKRGA
jgi:drug/metabolite transporter (DMT)-like permease